MSKKLVAAIKARENAKKPKRTRKPKAKTT